MNAEQRQEIIRRLQQGEDLSPEWARILFPPEKREYELVYQGKEREEDVIANTLAVPLQKVRTFGSNGDGWHNRLIFGDNLQVCKTLLEMKKAGQLKNGDGADGPRMIYIDPPFSTKQEFKGTRTQKAYQDKVVGSEFIEFLRKRVVLLHELLADDGVLFLHIDWRKGHYVKVVLDEIFGEHNFQNEVIWKRTGARSGSDGFNHIHDTIFLYSKSHSWYWDTQYTDYDPEYLEEVFKETDETGKRFQSVILTASGVRTGSSGLPWRGINPTEGGRHWAVPGFIRPQLKDPHVKDVRKALDQLDEMRRVIWPSKEDGIPRFKQYEDDRAGVELQSVWTDVRPVSKRSKEGTGYPT